MLLEIFYLLFILVAYCDDFFHDPDFLVPPQALGALRAVRDVRVRSAGPVRE